MDRTHLKDLDVYGDVTSVCLSNKLNGKVVEQTSHTIRRSGRLL
jgi:hypothetical protein